MIGSTSEIRKGLTIKFNHDIYTVVEFLHVKPGKGAAFVRTKIKSLTNGRVLENTFPSGAKIDIVRVERRPYKYLYRDGEDFVMMDLETYEQTPLAPSKVPNKEFLFEDMDVEILRNADDDTILSVDLPSHVVVTIEYTEPGIKGDTATNTLKPAKVTGGAEVRVPLFVGIGDKIRVDTSDGSYTERVKE